MQNIENRYLVSQTWVPRSRHPASSCQAPQGSPGLALAADRNWTQECTDRNLDQDRRQDKEQGPLQKPDMDEDIKTLMIPQL